MEIVLPSPADKLLWDLCVEQGCCGSYDDEADICLHVGDLLPETGIVTAEDFAALALRAEREKPEDERYASGFERIVALFVRHMGATAVPVEALEGNYAQPFESAASG